MTFLSSLYSSFSIGDSKARFQYSQGTLLNTLFLSFESLLYLRSRNFVKLLKILIDFSFIFEALRAPRDTVSNTRFDLGRWGLGRSGYMLDTSEDNKYEPVFAKWGKSVESRLSACFGLQTYF